MLECQKTPQIFPSAHQEVSDFAPGIVAESGRPNDIFKYHLLHTEAFEAFEAFEASDRRHVILRVAIAEKKLANRWV